jgi:hypothetical protein
MGIPASNSGSQINRFLKNDQHIKSERPGVLLHKNPIPPRPFEEATHFLLVVLIPTVAQKALILCKSPSVEINCLSAIGTPYANVANRPIPQRKFPIADKVQIPAAH